MRVRAAVLTALLLTRPAVAQFPSSPDPAEPRRLPPLGQSQPLPLPATVQPNSALPMTPIQDQPPPEGQRTGPRPDPSVVLPRQENLTKIDPSAITLRRQNDSWQLWAGRLLMRDFGNDGNAAQDALTALRSLRPTEWGTLGSPRPVIEYGLTVGEPPKWIPSPRHGMTIDLKTVRAEPVRGAWVVRDDQSILLNFGPHRSDAEQAAAVARRYGFNRIAVIGSPVPVMMYFYTAPAAPSNRPPANDSMVALVKAAQEANLTRTAVDVPGVGLVGERFTLDQRLIDARKDRNEWVLASGPDVIARFGYSELAARDAVRVVKDARLTEFCRVGGLTFFLMNGQPPTRIPFAAQGTRFDPARLVARENGAGGWAVCEGTGKVLFPAASQDEAELAIRVVQAYKFDQLCQVGSSPKASLRFLAKTGR